MLYLQVDTGDGFETIFSCKGWMEMIKMEAKAKEENCTWDLSVTGESETCKKFVHMSRYQKVEMWRSLDLQHEVSPETMTIAEVESYHYLKQNLWHLV